MENNVSGRNPPEALPEHPSKRGPGRPRRWEDARERRAAHRARAREWTQRLEELYVAMVNAAWDEPEVQRAVDRELDEEVVRVLIDHFRRRYRTRP